ncbi:Smr/MutS family protein [Flavobacterium agricola]|uniref:Smr/MutS family protein n=1 Tax=Flavobacterium agricola TaxID=2870839 RepID=A0ABY6M3E7_9FLAO|nr:Smr/MutS family protein [Flavobacterium agricola]UYW01731.1 Smr/MutS family protein [Flavobacterium agricola]
MNFEKGDKVAVLDDDITGFVTGIKKDKIVVNVDDFELEFNTSELIKIADEPARFFANVSVQQVLAEKADPKRKHVVKDKASKKEPFSIPYDLHIEKLVKDFSRMSNHDILTIQLDTARHHLEHAIRNRIPRIVLIHGVGEGVLKTELDFMLSRYNNVTFEDANYQKYGIGATQVYIKQNV